MDSAATETEETGTAAVTGTVVAGTVMTGTGDGEARRSRRKNGRDLTLLHEPNQRYTRVR